jgi:hypothetical protein
VYQSLTSNSVGIGTTNPQANLHVVGNVFIGQNLTTIQANVHIEQSNVFIGNSAIVNNQFSTTGPTNQIIFDNTGTQLSGGKPNKITLFSNISAGIYAGIGISSVSSNFVNLTLSAYGHTYVTNGAGYTTAAFTNSGTFSVGGFNAGARLYVTSASSGIGARIDTSGTAVALTTIGGGTVGFGTTQPTANLHVVGNVYVSNSLSVGTYGNVGSNIAIFSNGTNITVINSNAWVGIGTTNPTSSLQVNGNALFATDTFAVPFATVGTLGVLSGVTIGPSSTTLGSNLMVLSNASGGSNVTICTGNALSIGTLTPQATLHVVGSMGSNIAVFSNGFSNGVVINQWSNVGIGLGNPIVQLDLSTDGARKLSTTTWTTGSDQRVKSNIMDANLITCYDTIKSINLKYFQWNFPDAQPIDNHSLGFIAQEIADYFPKSVFPSDSHGFPDFLSLNTDQILKAMHGALQKTIADKEVLEEKLETAQNDIDLLETRLGDLEALVRTLLPQKDMTQTGSRFDALISQT